MVHQADALSAGNSTTSFLIAATMIYAIHVKITATAGIHLLMNRFHAIFWIAFITFPEPKRPELLCPLTTSLSQDWVIYAPSAFRKNGRRFSCALSGIEPLFSVTRECRGSPIHYQRADGTET